MWNYNFTRVYCLKVKKVKNKEIEVNSEFLHDSYIRECALIYDTEDG